MEVSAGDVCRSGASESPRTQDPVSNTRTYSIILKHTQTYSIILVHIPQKAFSQHAVIHPSVQDPHEKNCQADPGMTSSSSVLIINHVTN